VIPDYVEGTAGRDGLARDEGEVRTGGKLDGGGAGEVDGELLEGWEDDYPGRVGGGGGESVPFGDGGFKCWRGCANKGEKGGLGGLEAD